MARPRKNLRNIRKTIPDELKHALSVVYDGQNVQTAIVRKLLRKVLDEEEKASIKDILSVLTFIRDTLGETAPPMLIDGIAPIVSAVSSYFDVIKQVNAPKTPENPPKIAYELPF